MEFINLVSRDFLLLTLEKFHDLKIKGIYSATLELKFLTLYQVKMEKIDPSNPTDKLTEFIYNDLIKVDIPDYDYDKIKNHLIGNEYTLDYYILNEEIVKDMLNSLIFEIEGENAFLTAKNRFDEMLNLEDFGEEFNYGRSLETNDHITEFYNFLKDSDHEILKFYSNSYLTIEGNNFWENKDDYYHYNFGDFFSYGTRLYQNYITKSEEIMKSYMSYKFENSILKLIKYAIDNNLIPEY